MRKKPTKSAHLKDERRKRIIKTIKERTAEKRDQHVLKSPETNRESVRDGKIKPKKVRDERKT